MVTVVNGDHGYVIQHAGQRLSLPPEELRALEELLAIINATPPNQPVATPLITTLTDPRRAAHAHTLRYVQTLLDHCRYQYADDTRAFIALYTAWEALRIAVAAIEREELAHVEELTEAVVWLTDGEATEE